MLSLKLLAYVFLLGNVRSNEIDNVQFPSRISQRRSIVNSMSIVNDVVLRSSYVNYNFDLCRAEVDRALLCEAVNVKMNHRTATIIDEPCQKIRTIDAYFTCVTEDGVDLKLKTLYMENKVFLEINGRVHKVFQLPSNVQLLMNSAYKRYLALVKWMRAKNRTSEEILSKINAYKLPSAYELALDLEYIESTSLESVEVLEEELNGPDICHIIVNRGVLCQAVNIRIYGQTYPVENAPCKDEKSGSPYFPCKMASGDVNFMEQAKNVAHTYADRQWEVKYKIFSKTIHKALGNLLLFRDKV